MLLRLPPPMKTSPIIMGNRGAGIEELSSLGADTLPPLIEVLLPTPFSPTSSRPLLSTPFSEAEDATYPELEPDDDDPPLPELELPELELPELELPELELPDPELDDPELELPELDPPFPPPPPPPFLFHNSSASANGLSRASNAGASSREMRMSVRG